MVASAGHLLTTTRRSLPAGIANSENGPLAILVETEESRLVDSANDPLTVLSEVEEGRPSSLGATLLVILDSTVHSSASSKLLTLGFLVG